MSRTCFYTFLRTNENVEGREGEKRRKMGISFIIQLRDKRRFPLVGPKTTITTKNYRYYLRYLNLFKLYKVKLHK